MDDDINRLHNMEIGDEVPFHHIRPGMKLVKKDPTGSLWHVRVRGIQHDADGNTVAIQMNLIKPGVKDATPLDDRDFENNTYYYDGH